MAVKYLRSKSWPTAAMRVVTEREEKEQIGTKLFFNF